jgi:hypothetical protein
MCILLAQPFSTLLCPNANWKRDDNEQHVEASEFADRKVEQLAISKKPEHAIISRAGFS